MRIFSFHLMPYPGLPPDYEGPAWITCPNEFFDPRLGGELYNRYIDDLIYAEELGFDGVFSSKGDEQALVRQVASLFRMADMQAAKAARITGLPSASR